MANVEALRARVFRSDKVRSIAERSSVQVPTMEQVAATNVMLYLRLIDMFDEHAKRFVAWRGDTDPFAHARAKQQFEDYHFARNNPEQMERLERDWGEELNAVGSMYQQLEPSIKKQESRLMERAAKLRDRDIVWTAWKTAKRLPALSHEQREKVFELAGYSPNERALFARKVKISGGLSVGATALAYAMLSMAEGVHVNQSLMDSFQIRDIALAVGVSYLTHYGSIAIKAQQNVRLLRNPNVQNSADISATGAFLLLRKFLPTDETIQNRTIRVLSFTPTALGEIVWRVLSHLNVDPSVITVRNASGTLFNLVYAAAAEIILQKARR